MPLDSKADIIGEIIKVLMFIEYKCHWGFTVEELRTPAQDHKICVLLGQLQMLLEEECHKSQLWTELLKLCLCTSS